MAGVQEVFSWLALPLLTLTRAVLTCPAANFLSSGYVDQAWKEEHVAGLVSISGRYLLYGSLSGSALGAARGCVCVKATQQEVLPQNMHMYASSS
jgi:hypothetical protein